MVAATITDVILSPSQLSMWLSSEEEYYIRYFLGQKTPQTPAMAVGSAFDSFIKADLLASSDSERKALFGTYIRSVEPQCYEEAVGAGAAVYMAYKTSGAYDALKRELLGRTFVCEERTIVEVGGIKLNCVADLRVDGELVHDWKVNGYYSQGRPLKGYKRMWKDGVDKADIDLGSMECVPNGSDWTNQMLTYALIHQAKEVWVDQIIYPGPRVAQYRWLVGENKILDLYGKLMEAWERYFKTGVFLTEKARQDALDLLKA